MQRILVIEDERDIADLITFNLERVPETCSNGYRTFANTYWADPATGFVWKSEQWVGPRLEPMTVEVVRPHPGSPPTR